VRAAELVAEVQLHMAIKDTLLAEAPHTNP
jgi:hypothetical protein